MAKVTSYAIRVVDRSADLHVGAAIGASADVDLEYGVGMASIWYSMACDRMSVGPLAQGARIFSGGRLVGVAGPFDRS